MFVPLPLLVLLGLVLVAALFLALRPRREGGGDLIGPPRRPAQKVVYRTVVQGGLPSDIDRQARDLVGAGEIIQAIKLVRETTGLGLKEAKDIVDAMR